jgi:hypothetical protein
MTTISAAIGAILGWMVSIKWSKASMDAKEDIIRQKEEKIQHLEKNRDELLRLKDEQIKLLELQLKVRGNECRVSKKKS